MKLRDRKLRIERAVYPRLIDADTNEYICSFRTMENAREVVDALSAMAGCGESVAILEAAASAVTEMRSTIESHAAIVRAAVARVEEPAA